MRTIVWDLDDVLNDLMRSWLEKGWRKAHPGCTFGYHELKENPPHRILAVTFEEYLRSLDDFRNSDEARAMSPNESVLHWFKEHGNKARHIVLTSRPLEAMASAAEWIYGHFGKWIRTISYIPTRGTGGNGAAPDRTKKDFFGWFEKADVFIDDTPENAAGASSIGIQTFIVPQPWNKSTMSLDEILKRLTFLLKEK